MKSFVASKDSFCNILVIYLLRILLLYGLHYVITTKISSKFHNKMVKLEYFTILICNSLWVIQNGYYVSWNVFHCNLWGIFLWAFLHSNVVRVKINVHGWNRLKCKSFCYWIVCVVGCLLCWEMWFIWKLQYAPEISKMRDIKMMRLQINVCVENE